MAAASEPEPEFPLPQVLTYPASTPPLLITQGAEGRLYKSVHVLSNRPCALKYRPSKAWRHPVLDARLTKARMSSEAKVLDRCRREGVPVPAVYAMDAVAGWMMLEWIDGVPVRAAINGWLGERPETEPTPDETVDPAPLAGLMRRIGAAIGGLHRVGVVHGDLTTSNMMLRPWADANTEGGGGGGGGGGHGDQSKLLDGDVVIIDFGLATQSSSDEDRAVDIYVLERAFASTHPRAEKFFDYVLEAYGESFKKAPSVLKKLADVRMRGRKRSMLG
ncbi:kinase-like domain-containing protein [Bombardia bombarda]|uniref:EKC/KEOPS complex subunit BUD32 n=1 Tax=Bombardia bombarda TaxID=252184 RepID=A0AA40CFI2_9PEZI|nr:kinase-like domain-containing protein [Bombardia bombarda]